MSRHNWTATATRLILSEPAISSRLWGGSHFLAHKVSASVSIPGVVTLRTWILVISQKPHLDLCFVTLLRMNSCFLKASKQGDLLRKQASKLDVHDHKWGTLLP